MKRRRAAVVVLGDLGRSPRMQYHALSLANQAGLEVDIVAYGGNDPHLALLDNKFIHIHKMKQTFQWCLPKALHILMLPLKAIIQFVALLWLVCFKIHYPDVFIVQNPPSVPTLIAVKCASWLRGSSFVIDWHNFGYTLLGLSLGRNHILVRIYHWIEKSFGRMADGSLCVTEAMKCELDQNWSIRATVLYDQPPEFFRPATIGEKHELFCRLQKEIYNPHGVRDCITAANPGSSHTRTVFTTKHNGDGIYLNKDRPALIVSSTSWTPDEDFRMLLEAAVKYDECAAEFLNECDSSEEVWMDISRGKNYLYPRLLFIITGKGPERAHYEEKIRNLNLKRVAFRTMWLSAEDYPLLLGSADLGICLHTSSSGLDLPMKVVDMFGCGLPVCAVSYSCIGELVKPAQNGLLFSSPSELATDLMRLFKGFPESCSELTTLRNGALAKGRSARWNTEWENHAMALIKRFVKREGQ